MPAKQAEDALVAIGLILTAGEQLKTRWVTVAEGFLPYYDANRVCRRYRHITRDRSGPSRGAGGEALLALADGGGSLAALLEGPLCPTLDAIFFRKPRHAFITHHIKHGRGRDERGAAFRIGADADLPPPPPLTEPPSLPGAAPQLPGGEDVGLLPDASAPSPDPGDDGHWDDDPPQLGGDEASRWAPPRGG